MIKKSIKQKILEYFLVFPTVKLRVRQIERAVKVPFPSVVRYTKELESGGILRSEHIAGIVVYSADTNSASFLLEKRLFNIRSLHTVGLVDFIESSCSPQALVVFGAYAFGEDVEQTPISLYIEQGSKGKTVSATKLKSELCKMFADGLHRSIEVHGCTSLDTVTDKDFANAITSGIVLKGKLNVK